MSRGLCINFISQGFDACIDKLPAIADSLAKLPAKRLPLCVSFLPLESLKSMMSAAKAAVIRYHLSSMTPSPDDASSFGGILWRALKCAESGSRSTFCTGWRAFYQKWLLSCFGAACGACMPRTSLLESTAFFAAVVVPLVVQLFSAAERARFADGSFATIPEVWERIEKKSMKWLSVSASHVCGVTTASTAQSKRSPSLDIRRLWKCRPLERQVTLQQTLRMRHLICLLLWLQEAIVCRS